jgi:hypothetical protein
VVNWQRTAAGTKRSCLLRLEMRTARASIWVATTTLHLCDKSVEAITMFAYRLVVLAALTKLPPSV